MTDYRTVTVETLAAALRIVGYGPLKHVGGQMAGASSFEADYDGKAAAIFAALPATPAYDDEDLPEVAAGGPALTMPDPQADSASESGPLIPLPATPAEPLDVEAIKAEVERALRVHWMSPSKNGKPRSTRKAPMIDRDGLYRILDDLALTATEPREDFADPTAVDHPLYADQATEPREDRLDRLMDIAIDEFESIIGDEFNRPAIKARWLATLHPDTPETSE